MSVLYTMSSHILFLFDAHFFCSTSLFNNPWSKVAFNSTFGQYDYFLFSHNWFMFVVSALAEKEIKNDSILVHDNRKFKEEYLLSYDFPKKWQHVPS